MVKKCSKCKSEKSFNEFTNRKRSKDGKNSRCTSCTRSENKYHYFHSWEENRDRIDRNHYNRIKVLRKLCDDIKVKSGCVFCKYNTHPVALDFHHIKPDTKVATISAMINAKVTEPKLLNEIEKCIVVCSNCHRLLHNNLLFISTITPKPL